MKKLLVIVFFAAQITAFSQFPELAKTPPMGWNSWNAFGLNINSKIVKSVADSMVAKGLKDAGYEYIVIDDGWQIDRDKDGKIIVDSSRFPEGIKYLADYVHSKGLKFGIYTCCGTKTCGERPGSYGYEAIDAQTYAEWGVDFIKEDWCFTNGLDTRIQYKIMSDAIRATGRQMLLSLCEWGTSSPWEWAEGIGAMWRTTNDIQDCYDCIRDWGGMGWVPILEKNVNLAPFAGPGHWNDPDMLEVGNKALTPTESRAHFTMWCMLAAPLIAGNNISTMNDTIRDILTAPEIIAVDQDKLGIQGTRIRNENGLQVWQKPLSDGSIAVALLNVTKHPAKMYVSLEEIGFMKGSKSQVRDLWKQKKLPAITDIFQAEVEAHGVVVVKIKGKKSPVSMLKFAQAEIELNRDNHKLIQINVLPSVTPVKVSSSDEEIASLSLVGVNTYRITAKKEGLCTLKATTEDGKLNSIAKVKILSSNIPSPWKFFDIKDNKSSANFSNGEFLIEGGGADIWGGSDQFAYVSREAENDTYISARVISLTNTDPWAKTGLMFRESAEHNSAFVMISITPVNGLSLQWRDVKGKTCNKKDFSAVDLPVYLKLSKTGSTFTVYKSKDNKNWEALSNITLSQLFPDKYLVGMSVCSHSSHSLNLSKFDQVLVDVAEAQTIVDLSFHKNAPTPPLGWNSWDIFGTTVTEQQVKEQADAMAKNLLPSGYKYLTVDIQWYEPESERHNYNPKAVLTMDEYGRLTPGLKKFPSAADGKGFKPLADYVHSKGLKFGIHIMRGIPRQAVEKNLPVHGTIVHAQDIALKYSTCPWNPDMYGVDATKPEGQAYYNSIIQMYADWGVDYIKTDDISRPYDNVQKAEIEAIRKAIDKTGRPIVLSLSPGATPVSAGEHVMNHANLWRITDDFWDSWGLLMAMFERLDVWTPYRGPGHFPDADMLPIGIIDFGRQTKFTKDEQYTLMSLWAIGRSPLIFGGDMTKLDNFTKEMLTNPEMLKVNQESTNNRQVSRNKNLIVWTADIPNSTDKYVALFNAQSKGDNIDFSKADYISPVIAGAGSSHDISVSVKGGKKLVLFVDDGGNGFDNDHVAWVNPLLQGPNGNLKLTDLKWLSATSGWGNAGIDKTCDGRPLRINNQPANGIGTHSKSVIIYDIPEGYETFTVKGVVTRPQGSVNFVVFIDKGTIDYPDLNVVKVDFIDIGINGRSKVVDLWSHKELGLFDKEFSREIPIHGAGLYRISPIR